jgi:hypothetical protein
MKVAVCFSGELRSIEKCFPIIQSNVLDNILEYDLFYFTWTDDPDLNKLHWIEKHPNLKELQLEKRKDFDETPFLNKKMRHEVKILGMLRQLYCLQMSNNLKIQYEKVHGFVYDWVIRIRPDMFIINDTSFKIEDNMDNSKVYIPRHDNHYGYNDRFYVCSSSNMDILCDRLHKLLFYSEIGGIIHYEKFFKFTVDYNGLEVERIDLRFQLLRTNGHLDLLWDN